MGLFSIYTGFIYNDIFSKTLHIFHSGWAFNETSGERVVGEYTGHTYPFGLDPGWHGAENNLVFVNSYKMKMSVVLGVIHVRHWFLALLSIRLTVAQMTFALCLQLPNHLKFKKHVDIWTNFVPQIIFLESIFGYLVVCILFKWSYDWTDSPIDPPSLLNMLISMFLKPGNVEKEALLYTGQATVQLILLGLAAICVPWLLISKPYIVWRELKKIQGQGYIGLNGDDAPRDDSDDTLEGEEEGNGRAIAEEADGEHVSNFASRQRGQSRLTLL